MHLAAGYRVWWGSFLLVGAGLAIRWIASGHAVELVARIRMAADRARRAGAGSPQAEPQRRLLFAALVGLLAGAATASVHRGTWPLSFPVAGVPVVYAGVPALAIAGFLLFARRHVPAPRVTGGVSALAAVAVLVFSHAVVSVPLGQALAEWDVRRAQAFCERLVPMLEAAYRATGAYPRDVEAMMPARRPRLLAHPEMARWLYASSGDGFTLKVPDPRRVRTEYWWDSAYREWRRLGP